MIGLVSLFLRRTRNHLIQINHRLLMPDNYAIVLKRWIKPLIDLNPSIVQSCTQRRNYRFEIKPMGKQNKQSVRFQSDNLCICKFCFKFNQLIDELLMFKIIECFRILKFCFILIIDIRTSKASDIVARWINRTVSTNCLEKSLFLFKNLKSEAIWKKYFEKIPSRIKIWHHN